ncbi:SAM-dependent methyltransferase, partial [Bacillus cereus]
MRNKTRYQTWIRMKKLIVFLISSIILLLITLLPITFYLRILSGVIAIPFIYITFI